MPKHKPTLVTVTAAILIAAVTIMIMAGCGVSHLVLTDTETGEVYARYRLGEGEAFSISFKHSVNKTTVEEIYENRGGEIWQTGCVYYSFGAGVAEELDPNWTLSYGSEGEMILSDLNLHLKTLNYVVGTVYDHMLTIDDTQINLRELCGRNSSVRFEIS